MDNVRSEARRIKQIQAVLQAAKKQPFSSPNPSRPSSSSNASLSSSTTRRRSSAGSSSSSSSSSRPIPSCKQGEGLRARFIEKLNTKYASSVRSAVRSIFRQAIKEADPTAHIDSLVIHPADFASAVLSVLPGATPDEIRSLASDFDVDSDGAITVGEFIAMVEPGGESGLITGITTSSTPTPTAVTRTSSSLPFSTSNRRSKKPASDASVSTVLGSEWDAASMASAQGQVPDNDLFQIKLDDAFSIFIFNLKNNLEGLAIKDIATQPTKERLQLKRAPAIEASSKTLLRRHFEKYQSGGGTGTKGLHLPFRAFAEALSHFRVSGQPFPDKPAIERVWRACGKGDVDALIEAMYAGDKKQVVNSFGFGKSVQNPMERTNPRVEKGPFVVSEETQVPALKALKNTVNRCPTKPEQMPQRIRYRFCRTPVQPPQFFDTSLIKASSQRPTASLELEHVYGYCRNDTIPGPNLYGYSNGTHLVYTAAAVGVIHDVRRNRQTFLQGHTDDISALALDRDGRTAATGQMGKSPYVCVWDVATGSLRVKLGQGFFQRLVCCLGFSEDGTRLAAVSGDDHHMLGVWNIITGQLEAEAGAHNGSPPQVYGLRWIPWGADVQNLVTVGCSHLKLWTFVAKDNTKSKGELPGRLYSRAATFGKAKMPKIMTVVELARRQEAIVSGGDNGYVYIWKRDKLRSRGEAPVYSCVAAFFAHKGGCFSILSLEEGATSTSFRAITGGADGCLKLWDLSHCTQVTVDPEPSSLQEVIPVGQPAPPSPTIIPQTEVRRCPYPKDSVLKSVTAEIWEENVKHLVVRDLVRLEVDMLAVGLENGRVVLVDLVTKAQTDMIRCHHGVTQGLAVHPRNPNMFATTAEDGQLLITDADARKTQHEFVLPARARSVAYSPDGKHLAVGFKAGALGVYESSTLKEVLCVRHCKEDIDEVKYSPNGRYLAAASHDNYIDLYDTTKGYERVRRLKGHTSYLTHIDWSRDSKILQSNCGAYEIMYWDIKTGQMMRSTHDTVEANTDWSTWTCVLGFPVMGIWPPDSDGTDVNSVDRSADQRLLVTGDDFGTVKLYNYPVVVERAPFKAARGHASHVMNVRFLGSQDRVISVGGHDTSVFQWRVVRP